ncbi:MAG: hypothetical protein V4772_21560 [Pseudomonadota bacterium]
MDKLFGRTFGVQSLREVAILMMSFPWVRKAGAGGVAVALVAGKIGLYPKALFLSKKIQFYFGEHLFFLRLQTWLLTHLP